MLFDAVQLFVLLAKDLLVMNPGLDYTDLHKLSESNYNKSTNLMQRYESFFGVNQLQNLCKILQPIQAL